LSGRRGNEVTKKLIFADGTNGLWSLDETSETASNLFSSSNGVVEIANAGGTIFFTAGPAAPYREQSQLWVSDGTAGSAHLVMAFPDETPANQPDFSGIDDLVGLSNGSVVFEEANGTYTNQIIDGQTVSMVNETAYISNGTAAGTVPISGDANGSPNFSFGADLSGNFIFWDPVTGLWSLNETSGVAIDLLGSSGGVRVSAEAGGMILPLARSRHRASRTNFGSPTAPQAAPI
jgi:hypothetical protein